MNCTEKYKSQQSSVRGVRTPCPPSGSAHVGCPDRTVNKNKNKNKSRRYMHTVEKIRVNKR